MGWITRTAGSLLANYLTKPLKNTTHIAPISQETLRATLQPADVLLVEGDTRLSIPIKYLTQSTWSHAAIYIGENALPARESWQMPLALVEADLKYGVHAVTLAHYAHLNTRICRPAGLSAEDRKRVVDYVVKNIGHHYDLKHIFDLARYLLPFPVPTRLRRRMLALGSNDPSRAICSTLIAQAFNSISYPILPEIKREWIGDPDCANCYNEIYHIRHYSLYTPRDFDISPFFDVIKPTIINGFDYRSIRWK
ncbi:Permuted papain-like amidase enzyme, YaeF/YiiX, C92 family [Nitrosomonas sp. Nm51]|uniref:YiiX/YebB-like N1pC/P60 family cysteine hydrolase n=1 Tax=Nitrosomonas sp. Nm51 TaxID=133720 RepID=UPI0008C13C36|nr:YiiX/YebB-like N1pC/P60 family cysteine hydrolase [Nitrosomonas sp. Nm51]SER33986.1 Permuted papain-like amidase enzyme, YaeF/YiiX, C92 family [Nitrosomonas sp. Nm51]